MKELKFIEIAEQSGKNPSLCNSAESKNLPDWIIGNSETPVGTVSRIRTEWSFADHLGQIKSRTSAFRMRYAVTPGLYAVGEPDRESDVFVSANYKLSFDILRRELKGLNAWILVLDTRAINVWCAAGKGTFGTDELIKRIQAVQLRRMVNHNRIIVPQLGAVGVNARSVQKITGFRVYFGPVYAKNISSYIKNGYKKTDAMRKINFTMIDRLILTPMEINPAMKKFLLYAVIVLLLFGLNPSGILFRDAWFGGMPFLFLGLTAILAGALITPVLLPIVPLRSFAIKGWLVGLVSVFISIKYFGVIDKANMLFLAVSYLFFPLASSYTALQFTGSTTFTGMSGVKKELKFGIPIYISGVIISLILLIVFKLGQWRVL